MLFRNLSYVSLWREYPQGEGGYPLKYYIIRHRHYHHPQHHRHRPLVFGAGVGGIVYNVNKMRNIVDMGVSAWYPYFILGIYLLILLI